MAKGSETRERKNAKGKKTKEISENNSNESETRSTEGLPSGEGDASVTSKSSQSSKAQGQGKKKSREVEKKPGFLGLCCSKLKYVFLVLFIPPFLNYASLQRETTELKPAGGELYDIGWDQKLFLSCVGKGPPTVVLDAPTGMSSDVWTLVVKKLQEHANVCVYDRGGIGFSERPVNRSGRAPNPNSQLHQGSDDKWTPFTVERMADDLHKLISTSSQQARPLILVGAELGALVVQFYTQIYDDDVEGVVLINPLSEDLFSLSDGLWTQHWFGSLTTTYQTLQLGAALGVTRLGLLFGVLKQPVTGQAVPENVTLRQKYLLCHPRHLSSVVDEHHFINETFAQMRILRKVKPFPSNITVSVLSGNYYDEQMLSQLNKDWARAEQGVMSKLPNVQHTVVNGADRHMLYRKPEPIVEAILKMIRKWRRRKPKGQAKSF